MNELKILEKELESDIFCELIKFDNFADFFTKVCEIKLEIDSRDLKKLRNVVKIFNLKFNATAIVYLLDSIDAEMVLPCRNSIKSTDNISERDYQNYIVKNFNVLFPNFKFVCIEKKIKDVGRIDIYAKDKINNRDVVIELKLKSFNPTKQLIAYAYKFKNPILIGITEEHLPNITNNLIKYMTYEELGIVLEDIKREKGEANE